MAPNVKLTASMAVAIAATEVVLFVMSYIPMFHIGVRNLIPSLICDAGLIYMLKYITEHHFSVRKWQDAVKLSVVVSAFYTCLTGPGLIFGFTSLFYVAFLAVNNFIVISVMLLCLVYVKY